MGAMKLTAWLALPLMVAWPLVALAEPVILELEGDVPTGGPDHFFVPFAVPEGIVEIQIDHDDLSDKNILDFGLNDPAGFRGWGGGNSEPAVVGIDRASRSYVAGPIAAGQWRVVVGKAKLAELPARYKLTITLRDVGTLAAQPERKPYVDPGVLVDQARWYAGDFHVHSMESGDARPDLDEIAALAQTRQLDFALISDHNTLTQLEFMVEAQKRHPTFLFIPGMEYTTYAGHGNAIGATSWVDHKIGQPGVTIAGAVEQFRSQGALFSINHPILEIGDLCIGCGWNHQLDLALVDAVEIQTGSPKYIDLLFPDAAIAYWDSLCDQGHHLPAIGGSDDHKAGVDLGFFQSAMGEPTTLVYASELSVAGVIAGIRAGKTVVKLWTPEDPMVELLSSVPPDGDTIVAGKATLAARVTAGAGQRIRFVKDGVAGELTAITSDDFTAELPIAAPKSGESRYRVEIVDAEDRRRTVTSHLWIRRVDGGPPAPSSDEGCGCRVPAQGQAGLAAVGLAAALGLASCLRRRRRAC